MALIQCPECGREVSSTAGSCIHCGFQFTAPTLAPEREEPSAELKTAERHAAEDKAHYKKTGRLNRYVLIFANCLWIVAAIIFFVWWKSYDSLEQLLYYRRTHDAIYALIVLAAVFFSVEKIYDFYKGGYSWIRAAKKLESEKADYEGYVKSHFNESCDMDQIVRFSHAAYLAERPKEKTITLIDSVLSLVFKVIIFFSIDIFTCSLIGVLMDSTLIDHYIFDYGCLYWLIPCGISIFFLIVKYLFFRPHTKDYDQWFSLLTSGLGKSKKN